MFKYFKTLVVLILFLPKLVFAGQSCLELLNKSSIETLSLSLSDELNSRLADSSENNLLFSLFLESEFELLIELIDHTDVEINSLDENEQSLLMLASKEGNLDVVTALLKKSALDIQYKRDFYTALILASESGHLDVVNLFLENEVYSLVSSKAELERALLWSLEASQVDVTLTLFKRYYKIFPKSIYEPTFVNLVILGVESNQESFVTDMLGIGLDFSGLESFISRSGHNILTLAAQVGSSQLVKLFLEAGFDVNALDSSGRSALIHAAFEGHVEVVKLLMDHEDIAVNITNDLSQSAVYLAAVNGHVESVRIITENKTTLLHSSEFSVLRAVVEANNLELLEVLLASELPVGIAKAFLINRKTDYVDAFNHNGYTYTSFSLALELGYYEIAVRLLDFFEEEAIVYTSTSNKIESIGIVAARGDKDLFERILKLYLRKIELKDTNDPYLLKALQESLNVVMDRGYIDLFEDIREFSPTTLTGADLSRPIQANQHALVEHFIKEGLYGSDGALIAKGLILGSEKIDAKMIRLLIPVGIDYKFVAHTSSDLTFLESFWFVADLEKLKAIMEDPNLDISRHEEREITLATHPERYATYFVESAIQNNLSNDVFDYLLQLENLNFQDISAYALKLYNTQENSEQKTVNSLRPVIIRLISDPRFNINQRPASNNLGFAARALSLVNHERVFVALTQRQDLDANALDPAGFSLFHLAVKSNNLPAVKNLLENFVFLDINASEAEHSYLALAASLGHHDMFNYLLTFPKLLENGDSQEAVVARANLAKVIITNNQWELFVTYVQSLEGMKAFQSVISSDPTLEVPYEELDLSEDQLRVFAPTYFLGQNDIRLEDLLGPSEVQEALRSNGYSDHIVDLIYDRVLRRDVGLWLFYQALLIDDIEAVENSSELLVNITQANFTKDQLEDLSDSQRSDFFEMVIQMYVNSKGDSKVWSFISDDLYSKNRIRALMDFLSVVDALYKLEDELTVSQVFSELLDSIDQQITGENIDLILERGREILIEKVNKLLSTDKFTFDFEDFKRLQEEWGDLSPVWILLARLQATDDERKVNAVSTVRRIFEVSLDGLFKQYKFEGITEKEQVEANRQLEMLDDRQKERWSNPEIIVRKAEGVATASELWQQSLEAINVTLETNLEPHMRSLFADVDLQVDEAGFDLLDRVLQEALVYKGEPQEFFDEGLDQQMLWSRIYHLTMNLKNNTDDVESFRNLLNIIKLTIINSVDNSDMKKQTLVDLNDLTKRVSENNQAESQEILVASVMTWAPRMLITVGDAVQCSSCQNYLTGGMIQSLPGYVIDANVQAVLSYALNTKDFSPGSFRLVSDWFSAGDDVVVSFDGNRKIFQFKNNGEVINSRELGFAYLRNLIKVGSIGEQAAVFMERDYSQSHPQFAQMRKQHAEIFNNLARDLDALTSGVIEIRKSRNPSGQYSDAGGGENVEDYTINAR